MAQLESRPVSESFDYASSQRGLRRHARGIALVLLLHALLVWAIASGLARQVVKMADNTVEAVLLSDTPAPATPPKAPPPKTPTPPPPLPSSTAAAITTPAAPAAPVVPAAPAVHTGAAIQPGAHCAKPDYPSASRRFEEEGSVALRFLIDTDGKVLKTEIDKSSGFPRLDEAARNALSKCQFRPGTVDGKPEQSWANITYKWRLE
jgi:protein TonB